MTPLLSFYLLQGAVSTEVFGLKWFFANHFWGGEMGLVDLKVTFGCHDSGSDASYSIDSSPLLTSRILWCRVVIHRTLSSLATRTQLGSRHSWRDNLCLCWVFLVLVACSQAILSCQPDCHCPLTCSTQRREASIGCFGRQNMFELIMDGPLNLF